MSDFHVVDTDIVMGDKNLVNHKKLMSMLRNYYKVSLRESDNRESFSELLCWCFENCKGKFRDIPDMRYNRREWYFEFEKDATMFALKWGHTK